MENQTQINDLASELMQATGRDCIDWMEGDIDMFRKTNCPTVLIKTFEERVAKMKGNLAIAEKSYLNS